MEAAVTPSPRKARRAAPKALNLDAKTIARQADANADRKKASKKALRDALAPAKPKPVQPMETPEEVQRQRNLEAARAEAEVTGMTFEEACASMGIDPQTGQPVEQEEKSGYAGPMLALRRRLKAGAYKKAENGRPCCGDAIAVLCGKHTREVIVKALIVALGLGSNPYAHLNPGQQSMNLRNKARAAVKNGTLEIAKIEAALIEASKG